MGSLSRSGQPRPGRIDLRVLASPEFARDPYPHYSAWRDHAHVQKVEGKSCWMILGYDAALCVLRDHVTYSSKPNANVSPSLNGADQPAHTALRRILQPYFTPESQLTRRQRVGEIVRERLEHLRRLNDFDAIADFTSPVAHTVACDWLGMTEQGAAVIRARDVTSLTWRDVEDSIEPDGLMDRLAGSDAIDRQTLAELAGFFLMAGVETAREVALFSLQLLQQNPRVVTELAASPSRLPAFLSEFLRLEPPAHTLFRLTRSEVELNGVRIPAGKLLWISIAAANRDPLVFADPNAIDPSRKARHLSFSVGPHFCLGSHLGQVEGEVMLSEILPDLPRLLDRPGSPELRFVGTDGAPSLRQVVRWRLSLR